MDAERRLKFVTADVFTDKAYGGNPLAVILDGRGLSTPQMHAIAREFNLSETTFVLPSIDAAHHARVRIFTPGGELAFAGHPTVGTAWVLASLGQVPRKPTETKIVFEENVGPIPIRVRWTDEQPSYVDFSTAQVPVAGPTPPNDAELAAMLSLEPADIASGTPPMTLSCGTWFVCVPLASSDAVRRAKLVHERWAAHLVDKPANKIFLFTRTGPDAIHARMFAPGIGVAEDPATGAAACAVTGWLVRDAAIKSGTSRWAVTQGVEMGRPSTIALEADVVDGVITAVRCGGTAVLISEGEIRPPDEGLPAG